MKKYLAILTLMLTFIPSILPAQGKTIEIKIIDKRYQPPARTLKIPPDFKGKGARFVVRAGDVIKICNADKLFAKPTSLSKENKFQGVEGQGGLRPGSCISVNAQNPTDKPVSFWLHDDIHGSARLFMVVLPANWPDEGEENTPLNDMATTAGTCTLSGIWIQTTKAVGETKWTITSDGEATEEGIGYAKGKAKLDGNTLSINWQTTNGYSGYYQWYLNSNCNTSDSGSLVFKTPITTRHDSSVKRKQ